MCSIWAGRKPFFFIGGEGWFSEKAEICFIFQYGCEKSSEVVGWIEGVYVPFHVAMMDKQDSTEI